ncbi:hypothetical protein M5689_014859 [Euphorbia peplus]|nr:hypothetical protein M5689_014859 [Euphorbia peplus]
MFMSSMFRSLYGHKVEFSGASAAPSDVKSKVPAVEESIKKCEDKEKKSASSQPPTRKKPRFAPELDGVHCFETILPY